MEPENKPEAPLTWNKPDKDGIIHVPDELDPLINKIAMQIKFLTLSDKPEGQTICDIVAIAQDFFNEKVSAAFHRGAREQREICAEHATFERIEANYGLSVKVVSKDSILNAPEPEFKA